MTSADFQVLPRADEGDDEAVQPRVAGVIVAAGRGTRYGSPDKVMLLLQGRPVLEWVLQAFSGSLASEIVIVVGGAIRGSVEALVAGIGLSTAIRFVAGGDRRQDSVACGVAAVGDEIDLITIHDAARPLVSASLIDRTIERAVLTGAAIAASPVTDTLKRVGDDLAILETVAREGLWAAQTPQVFDRQLLVRAYATPTFQDQTFTDEAALFEALGHRVAIVPNYDPNPKVTHPGDLALIQALLAVRSDPREPLP